MDNKESFYAARADHVARVGRHGAPMGWTNQPDGDKAPVRIALRMVSLDGGGYDPMGYYYGHGESLYEAVPQSEVEPFRFRALNRKAAKAFVWVLFPNATFFR